MLFGDWYLQVRVGLDESLCTMCPDFSLIIQFELKMTAKLMTPNYAVKTT